jgi:predicted DNA-binding mobile mystery protein A
MTVKRAVSQQYQEVVNRTAKQTLSLRTPSVGWLRAVRKALGMTGANLARRMDLTRARIAKAEKAELDGSATIKSMRAAAEAMGCQFVYAIVPPKSVENLIIDQARKKAMAVVMTANKHMALESQMLSKEKIEQEITRLTRDFVHEMPSDLWDGKCSELLITLMVPHHSNRKSWTD